MTDRHAPHGVLRTATHQRVLRALFQHGPISQQGLIERAHVHQTTVSRILADLKRAGLVCETDVATATASGPGRRPTSVDLDRTRAMVIGIQIGMSQAHAGLVDLKGRLVAHSMVTFGQEPPTTTDAIVEMVRQLVDTALPETSRILGIGVGAAGVVDAAAGTVRPGLRDDDISLTVKADLERAFAAPVFLSSNVHAMALAESWFGESTRHDSLALLFVARVIRLAHVIDGRVHHGSGPRDGMLGHAVLDPGGPPCACGQRGCLEALAGDSRVESEALRLAEALPTSSLARHLAARTTSTLGAIANAWRDGDPGAVGLLENRARWLARAIVLVNYVIHPSRLLLADTPRLLETNQLELIQQEVARLAPHLAGDAGVSRSTLPVPDIAIIGSATLVLEAFYAQDGRWMTATQQGSGAWPAGESA